ncbi:MAG: hypothetical protein RL189_3290 [Pseudomonadota bacterium]|jgi:uncharacterized protein YoxC
MLRGENQMFWRALSLRSKLMLLTLAGLFTAVFISFWQLRQSYRARQSALKSDFRIHAASAAGGIAANFAERYTDVQAFALNSVFQSGNREQMTNVLNSLVAGYQVYDTIMFVDATGAFVASNNRSFDGRALDTKVMDGRSFADTPWFQRAFRGESSDDKLRGFSGSTVEDLQVDPISTALHGATLQGMSFSKAVIASDGRVAGVVTARASLRFVESEMRSSFERLRQSGLQTAQLLLMNKDGLLSAEITSDLLGEKGEVKRNQDRILRWNVATQQGQFAAQEAVAGRSGSVVEFDRVGRVERLWGYAPLREQRFPEGFNWSIVVSVSADEVLGDLLLQRNISYGSLAFVLFAFGLLGYGTARSISRELLECSVRMKEDSIRLVEAGDELNEALRKVADHDPEEAGRVAVVEEQGKGMLDEIEKRTAALAECSVVLQRMHGDLGVSLERSGVVIESVRSVNAEILIMDEISSRLDELQGKLAAINEIVFKAQLVSFNASIEANRAGQFGKGFASIAAEIQLLSESTEQVAREINEISTKTQRKMIETTGSLRARMGGMERNAADWAGSLESVRSGFPAIVRCVQETAESLQGQDQVVGRICETVERVEVALAKASQIRSEVNRHVQDVREQSYRLEDLVQDLGHVVKGVRTRSRLKKNANQDGLVASRVTQATSERARADAVDRLAQKMRPRLVVESDGHEPEVTDFAVKQESNRRAG